MPTDKLELRSEDRPLSGPFPGSLPREARETQKRRERVAGGDGTGERGRYSYGNRNEGKNDVPALFVFLLCLLCQNHAFSPSFPPFWGTK